jgi:transposase
LLVRNASQGKRKREKYGSNRQHRAAADPRIRRFHRPDWGDQKHAWSLQEQGSTRIERGEMENTPEAMDLRAVALAQRFGGRLIAVALEQARGAVIGVLSKYACFYLYPVHSTTSANYRKSFSPSGAKSDPTDADMLLDLLLKHREQLRALRPDTEQTRSLQILVEERRKQVDLQTSQSQRLTTHLKQSFPQILKWFDDVKAPLVANLLERWPTLEQLQKARPETLRKFFHKNNCRSAERIDERLVQIREAAPATYDQAVLSTGILIVHGLLQILAALHVVIAGLEERIETLVKVHPDFFIVDSLPGAGPVMGPRLIAVLGTDRDRFTSASELPCWTGIAPVVERSGKQYWVHWRWACSKFVRQTIHEWAQHSMKTCSWAREHYDLQRSRNKSHHAAVRSLAFKWLRILFRCWKNREPYNEARYEESLRRHAPKAEENAKKTTLDLQWKSCGGFSKLV